VSAKILMSEERFADFHMLGCRVAVKNLLLFWGESWSLLQSGFGKIIPYLSHAIWLGSILWKHGSEPI